MKKPARGVLHAFLAGAVLASATVFPGTTPASNTAGEELVILTWADYIDPELVVEFEQETGARVSFRYFESDDARDEILSTVDGVGFDLALVNGLMLDSYAQRDWLQPLDTGQVPNLAHLEARWREAFPASDRYGVPYFWGTLGIAYRQDLLPGGLSRWSEFFEPAEPLRGHISLMRSSRDVFGMALKALGHSVNSGDREAVRAAAALLQRQKPYVRSYEYVSLGPESALVTGDVHAAMMYSGDALMVQEHHPDIVYVVPEEGSNLWVDYFVVMRSSTRKDLAARFLDFINRPASAARNAEFVYYATPNVAARPLLSREYVLNAVIHPDQSVLARSEYYGELPPRTQKTLNSEFALLVR